MNIEDFISTLQRDYPGGMYIHPIMQEGGWVRAYIRKYLETNNNTCLYIAHEYLKTMNKKLGSKFHLSDIYELKDVDLIKDW